MGRETSIAQLQKGSKSVQPCNSDVATSCGLKPLFEGDDAHNQEHKCCICGKTFCGYGNTGERRR